LSGEANRDQIHKGAKGEIQEKQMPRYEWDAPQRGEVAEGRVASGIREKQHRENLRKQKKA